MSKTKEYTKMLIKAAEQGYVDDVQRLLPLSDPKLLGNRPLRLAANGGHTQCVELLIPVSDPKTDDSWALKNAAENGHTQCVALLIPVSTPKARDSAPLRWAVINGHTQCMELLYPVSDPVLALKHLQEDFPNDSSKWRQLQQMVEAEQLNAVLYHEIGAITGAKAQKKM